VECQHFAKENEDDGLRPDDSIIIFGFISDAKRSDAKIGQVPHRWNNRSLFIMVIPELAMAGGGRQSTSLPVKV